MMKRSAIGFQLASLLFGIVAFFAIEASASAYAGYVQGTFSNWNKNGGYCPTGSVCTGSRYAQTQYDAWEPVRDILVNVYRASDNAFLGQGVTNDIGGYIVYWYSSTPVASVYMDFYAIQSSWHFTISDTNGNWYHSYSSAYTIVNNGTRQIPPQYRGSSASPDLYWNAYWGAERVWNEAFNYVGVLQTSMTSVDIRGFANAMPSFLGTCNSSCASGSPLRVQLDLNAALTPQGRVMHEMGHVASAVEQPAYKGVANYCYPNTAPTPPAKSCTWNQGTPQWGTDGFEEAFATLGGNVTLWDGSATNPTSCLTSTSCFDAFGYPLAGTNLEASSYAYATNSCVTDENRWPLSHMRFQWDVYDWHNDADGDTIQQGLDCFWCLFTNMHSYAAGTAANQVNEQWNSTLTSVDNYDGRGSSSYRYNYQAAFAVETNTLRVDNCYSP